MTIAKTLTSALFIAGAALAASASTPTDTFTVDFDFVPGAPVEQTYAQITRTADRACRSEYRFSSMPLINFTLVRACKIDLIDKAVRGTGDDQLIAHHEQVTDEG